MMISLAPPYTTMTPTGLFPANRLGATQYARTSNTVAGSPTALGGASGFPVFGNAGGFSAHQGFNQFHPNHYGQHPNHGGLSNGWMSLIQLLLQKLFHRGEAPKTPHDALYDDAPTTANRSTASTRSSRRGGVYVNGKRVEGGKDVVINPSESKYTKKKASSKTEVEGVPKATLPKGVTPLSYNKLMNDKAYYTDAKEALTDWQAHMKKYEGKLNIKKDRNQWVKGAVTYLALLNNHEVRDELLTKYPVSIATYYNTVLRTLRQNDDVREAMQADPQYAKVLAVVDKTNKAIFEHTIFQTKTA
jgi:hypothetical protein